MKKAIFGVFGVVLFFGLMIFGFSRNVEINETGAEIIATNFIGYDFARAIAPEGVRVEMLMRPGVEVHGFEPSVQDISRLESAKLIVLNGGESEEWVEKLMENNLDLGERGFRMMGEVETVPEGESLGEDEHEEGEEEEEIDEHVWTSPVNVIKILSGLERRMAEVFPEQAEEIILKAEKYSEEFNEIDVELRDVVNNSLRKKIVVADRFPFIYLTREYGLEYLAAFPGCAESTEVNPKVLSVIIDTVKAEEIPVVYKIEMGNGVVAETVARETGARLLELESGHSVTEDEFREGVTYAEMLRRNVVVLKEGLR